MVERETAARERRPAPLQTTGHPPAVRLSANGINGLPPILPKLYLEFITPVDGDIEHMLTFMRDVHCYTARQL